MKRQMCTLGNHAVVARPVRNQGFEFSRCRRCGRDLVRSRHRWRTVPRGFRVVWRRAAPVPAAEPSAAQLLLDLPPVGRSLITLSGPGGLGRRLAAALELALLGLQGLAWLIAARMHAWYAALKIPSMAGRPTLRLPAG